jgi:hypothetical protein
LAGFAVIKGLPTDLPSAALLRSDEQQSTRDRLFQAERRTSAARGAQTYPGSASGPEHEAFRFSRIQSYGGPRPFVSRQAMILRIDSGSRISDDRHPAPATRTFQNVNLIRLGQEPGPGFALRPDCHGDRLFQFRPVLSRSFIPSVTARRRFQVPRLREEYTP